MKTLKLLIVALLISVCGTAAAQSKEHFQRILEDFCQTYYEDGFGGKQYIEGTLSVKSLEVDEYSEVIKVKGKHSYRGQYIPFYGRKVHSSVDFKAELSDTRNGTRVKFWKWYEPDVYDPKGHWEGPIEKVILL